MVLTDLPSMQSRSRTLQLKFLVRLQSLPVTAMARAVELSFLWNKQQHDHWKKLSINNPYLKLYKQLKNQPEAPKCPIKDTVKQKRDKEYTDRGKNRKTVQCLRTDRRIDPILYLPVTSRDRHRLIKWRMHWFPSYPLQDCRCGATAATREHYTTRALLQQLLKNLLEAFGPIPNLVSPQQPIDHILNRLPRSEVGLTLGPAPEEALQATTSITSPPNI
ncbi:hypothetical protein INT45_011113 [Circinella minor]|uniref:Uncharacterized protein n=1 Tax=Circinella minor TaxID=1195481 RepID=A0A8H7VMP1_9FUNG|nr:hypothetical protein INT45_011113 [Circinella minor]